ncbi:MAG TPA: DUF58 domain-containing protein [Bacteroidales bacterium]|nr:DUF58 domain-containing protein [Bacteroidales bacterium]
METTDIIKKVKKIEIKTRGLSQHIFSGQYHSAFKGTGISFAEVREYQFGDDIRSIDWNVTARFNHPYVKIFEEERELTVMLIVDVSGSTYFGTKTALKKELIAEIAAVLSFSAIHNNDKVGVIFFSNKIEKYIPPKKGTSHILRIIRELIDFKSTSRGTDISIALKFLINVIKKRCTAFVISDFLAKNFENPLKISARKHDIISLQIIDAREIELPNIGLMYVKDAETNQHIWVDTSSNKIREIYQKQWQQKNQELKEIFTKCGVDNIEIFTGSDYIKPLMKLFKMRERK